MKWFLIIFMVFSISGCGHGYELPGIGQVKFGMNPDEVMIADNFKAKLGETSEIVPTHWLMRNVDESMKIYSFYDNKLFYIGYLGLDYKYYKNLVSNLEKKHGRSFTDDSNGVFYGSLWFSGKNSYYTLCQKAASDKSFAIYYVDKATYTNYMIKYLEAKKHALDLLKNN